MDNTTPTIQTSVLEGVTYLDRPAMTYTMSLAKYPGLATGKRVVVREWLDTNELELRFITGTFSDVVEFASEVIPYGTVVDAQNFARLHLLGGQS
jgi:hypothetical protein